MTKGYDKFKKQTMEALASHWTNKQVKKRNNNNERSAPDYADLKNPNNINNGRAGERKIKQKKKEERCLLPHV